MWTGKENQRAETSTGSWLLRRKESTERREQKPLKEGDFDTSNPVEGKSTKPELTQVCDVLEEWDLVCRGLASMSPSRKGAEPQGRCRAGQGQPVLSGSFRLSVQGKGAEGTCSLGWPCLATTAGGALASCLKMGPLHCSRVDTTRS